MNEVYEKTFRVKGWWDETATIQGWFGEDFAETLGPSTQTITLPIIGPEETVFTPTVTRGAVTITLPYLDDSSDSLFAPTLAQVIALPYLNDADTLSTPTITPGAVTITLPLISDGDTLNAPTISVGSVTITLPYLDDSADSLFTPTLTVGGVTLTLPLIGPEETLYDPTVSVSGGSGFAQTLELPTITNTSSLFEMALALRVTLPKIDSTSDLYGPNVAQQLYIPWKNNRDQDSFLYPPTVRNYQIIQLPWIPTSSVLYGATLKQNMTLAAIGAEEVVYPPSVQSTYALTLPLITSGSVDVPTVDTTAPTLYTPHIPSEEVVYTPYRVEKPRKVYTGVGWK